MKKYKRIELQVKADQYFGYNKIDVEGFQNVVTEYLDKDTMQKKSGVFHAVIQIGDKSMRVEPGNWVVQLPNGKIQVREHDQFTSDFVEA